MLAVEHELARVFGFVELADLRKDSELAEHSFPALRWARSSATTASSSTARALIYIPPRAPHGSGCGFGRCRAERTATGRTRGSANQKRIMHGTSRHKRSHPRAGLLHWCQAGAGQGAQDRRG